MQLAAFCRILSKRSTLILCEDPMLQLHYARVALVARQRVLS